MQGAPDERLQQLDYREQDQHEEFPLHHAAWVADSIPLFAKLVSFAAPAKFTSPANTEAAFFLQADAGANTFPPMR